MEEKLDKIIAPEVVSDLRLLIKDDDLSLATRLLLDFITDADLSKEYFDEALTLRAAYNQLDELKGDERKVSKIGFLEKFNTLLDEIGGKEEQAEESNPNGTEEQKYTSLIP